jgi:hypothetical protein
LKCFTSQPRIVLEILSFIAAVRKPSALSPALRACRTAISATIVQPFSASIIFIMLRSARTQPFRCVSERPLVAQSAPVEWEQRRRQHRGDPRGRPKPDPSPLYAHVSGDHKSHPYGPQKIRPLYLLLYRSSKTFATTAQSPFRTHSLVIALQTPLLPKEWPPFPPVFRQILRITSRYHMVLKNIHTVLENIHTVKKNIHMVLKNNHMVLENIHMVLKNNHMVLENNRMVLKNNRMVLENNRMDIF